MPDPIEDGNSFKENAIIKAQYYYNLTKIPCLCDDSGLCVVDLNGDPGINSARYSGGSDKDNRDLLRKKLKGMFPAKAYFNCDLIYYDGKEIISANGKVYGEIIDEERGCEGFGYDAIFYYPPFDKTLAQMDMDEKNQISHRGVAIKEMINKLKEK